MEVNREYDKSSVFLNDCLAYKLMVEHWLGDENNPGWFANE
jgi:hypothetical protein